MFIRSLRRSSLPLAICLATALVATACSDDPDPQPQNTAPSCNPNAAACNAPAAACEGNFVVTYASQRDDETCMCVNTENTRTDCAANSQVCVNGACSDDTTDPCAGVTCDAPAASCDGNTAVTYTSAGVCDADGECDFTSVIQRNDCGDDTCMAGVCVPAGDLCANVTCNMPPAASCDGEFAVTYTGDGMCVAATGDCDYSAVEVRTDCEATGETCFEGACLGNVDLCDGITCDMPPAASCDGEFAVTYSGDGMCVAVDGSCDYSAVETRVDCAATTQICANGACVDPADPCDGVICDTPPAPSCDPNSPNVAVAYTGSGMCTAATGVCDYSAVETRTDCATDTCNMGVCVPAGSPCDGVTCDMPPAPSCVGNSAVTYTGDGMCVLADGTCDYTAVMTTTDCGTGTCTAGACVPATPTGACLIISEYVEGSSNNKALELFNCGSAPLDLNGYGICQANGGNIPCTFNQYMLPMQTLPAGEVIVICNASSSADLKMLCDIDMGTGTTFGFNGNDRLGIFFDTSGTGAYDAATDILMDYFGYYDGPTTPQPPLTWADRTYRRCNFTPYLNTPSFDVLDYYTEFPQDTFDDLGIAPVAGCPTPPPTP